MPAPADRLTENELHAIRVADAELALAVEGLVMVVGVTLELLDSGHDPECSPSTFAIVV